MSKIYIMIGLPGSGKSYQTKKIQEKSNKAYIVSRDDFRKSFFGGVYTYDQKYERDIKLITNSTILSCINLGVDVIIDETHFTKKSRIERIELVKKFDHTVEIIYVWCSESENNLKYRMQDPKGQTESQWKFIIQNMKRNYEFPKDDEVEFVNIKLIEIKR